MYRKFELKITDYFYNNEINPYLQNGNEIYEDHGSKTKRNLKEFILENKRIDGTAVKEHWFNPIQADIFISHSHNDLNKVKAFAGWLHNKFGLTAFIDSCVWGYCDELLKEIDERYCKNSYNDTYDYKSRNYSTSHVHMMLSIALAQMMDSTESVVFYNTPNSVCWEEELHGIKSNKKKTLSPWIYYELANTKLIGEKMPKREIKHFDNRKAIFEARKNLEVEHDITEYVNDMIELNDKVLEKWDICYQKRNCIVGDECHPLDILYEIIKK